MSLRCLVLLALVSPLAAAEPRADPDGVPLPAGGLARLGSTRFRVWDGLGGPVFTPTGQLLFTEAEKQAVHFRFMDARTGLFVRKETIPDWRLAEGGSLQEVLGVSDDGRTYVVLAAAAATRTVHIVTYDIAAGRVIARVPLDVKSGVPPFSNNLRYFARYDQDTGVVTVTDARTGVRRPAGRVDPEERPELVPAPDGQTVVVSTDSATTVVAVPTGEPIREVVRSAAGQTLTGLRATYAADGRSVVIQESGKDNGRIWRCDTRTGKTTLLKETSLFMLSALSPDGSQLVLVDRRGKCDRLVRLSDERGVGIAVSSRSARAFDGPGTRFVTWGENGVSVHDADTGEPLVPTPNPPPTALQFHDGGRTVAGFSDNNVTLWDTTTGREVNRFDRPKEWRGQPFAGGRKVFAEVAPGDFGLTDPRTGWRDATNWKFLANARAWQPTACGRYVVAAFSNDGQTRLQKFAASSDEVVAELHGLPIRQVVQLSISDDGNRVALAGEHPLNFGGRSPPVGSFVLVGDLAAERTIYRRRHHLDFEYKRLWLSGDGGQLLVQPVKRQTGFVTFDDDSNPFADGGLIRLDRDDTLPLLKDDGNPLTVAFSPDGRALAVADLYGAIRVHETATGGLRATFRHKNTVTALAFSSDGTKLAAASSDAPMYLWDVRGTLRNLPTTFDHATGDALWATLTTPDAAKAFDAMQRLAAAPADAVMLFARKQPPAVVPAPDWFAARRTSLESRDFAVRERATRELTEVAEVVQPWLLRERKRTSSPEAQARLAKSLGAIGSNSPDRLRVLRSVEVLQWARTPAARELLKSWANGAPLAPLAVAAMQALRR